MDKWEIEKHVAYHIVISSVKLPRISQHPILRVGYINQATYIKILPKRKVISDTISTYYPVGLIKSVRNIIVEKLKPQCFAKWKQPKESDTLK